MKRLLLLLVTTLLLSGLFFNATTSTFAEENSDDLNEKKAKVEELQQKIKDVSAQKVTLASTIELIATKVKLTQAEIAKTQTELNILQKQLEDLGVRITGLDQSLDKLTNVLIERVQESYRQRQVNPTLLLLRSDGVSEFVSKYKYVQVSQDKTRNILQQAEAQKLSVEEQKQLKEAKQAEVQKKQVQLSQQQRQLTQQQRDQEALLERTRNDEKRYQDELQRTLAEIQAIQSIIAGKADETKVGNIGAGETIASIIEGRSPCSTGTHLHFEVSRDGAHLDPAEFLKSEDVKYNYNADIDPPISFRGGWDWPVYDPATITQQWGMSWFARVQRAYGGGPHTGIDLVSKSGDLRVRAVKSGELFRGGINCGGGTLRYVRVDHKDGINTYYLHVNY